MSSAIEVNPEAVQIPDNAILPEDLINGCPLPILQKLFKNKVSLSDTNLHVPELKIKFSTLKLVETSL